MVIIYPGDLDHPEGFQLSTTELWNFTCQILAHPELKKNPNSGIFWIANFTRNWMVENVSLSEICYLFAYFCSRSAKIVERRIFRHVV